MRVRIQTSNADLGLSLRAMNAAKTRECFTFVFSKKIPGFEG